MFTLLAAKMTGKWGMMERGESAEYMDKSPLFVVGAVFHMIVALLIFIILLFVAMLLWEKIKFARFTNRNLKKGK